MLISKMILKIVFVLTGMIFGINECCSQEAGFYSIHKEQSEYYRALGLQSTPEFDSINCYKGVGPKQYDSQSLVKRVFGYFPYWAGSNYLNYQWNLLSDLCYFSYEVDPAIGDPVTIHDWNTSPAIDSALANDVKVHLCVTLFSGHSIFFNSPVAQQTLISNVIALIQDRGAHGVNMDVEALPSSLGNAFTNFIIDLTDQVHTAIPGCEVSIASPAVNWSGTFNLPALNQHLDFFMVMGYDYYWNGSTQAGPVSPLYSMAGNYDYNFSKTISYYQSQGVATNKILMGVPYYARQWPTEEQYSPSNTTGSGTAFTYRYVKLNSSGNYSVENRNLEPNSLSIYYSFNSGSWNQCFLNEVYDLGKKYDVVNRRNLGGIGIWALGYDDGYTELWGLIANKFSSEAIAPEADTIYDSGGPAYNYYNDEIYLYTISAPLEKTIQLTFEYFDLEPEYDSLWIYDGQDTTTLLLGAYSGIDDPGTLISTSHYLTLKFSSDVGITGQGWKAIYQFNPPSAINEKPISNEEIITFVYPNPFATSTQICYEIENTASVTINVYDYTGKRIRTFDQGTMDKGLHCIQFQADQLPSSIYFYSLEINGIKTDTKKMTLMR
jgi:hypothetical protein